MPQLLCSVRDCHLQLAREEHRVVCPRGHAFDIARSGYINLLQPQDRRSKSPGDSMEAVAARRRFLDHGHAEPLFKTIRDMAPQGDTLLDAGCGDGYYLASLGRGGCGVDISTAAIDLAARRYPQYEWVVANADRFIPYADASFDLILSITGRMNPQEFRRVGRGYVIVAVAAPEDLMELRGSRGRDRLQRTIHTFAAGFKLVRHERVTTIARLDSDTASDILVATYRPRIVEKPIDVHLSLDVMLFR